MHLVRGARIGYPVYGPGGGSPGSVGGSHSGHSSPAVSIMSSTSTQRRPSFSRILRILRISLFTVAVSGLLMACSDLEREEGLRQASRTATDLRADGDSVAARRGLARALTLDSAAVAGRWQWGRYTEATGADSVASWLAFRLGAFHVEQGDTRRALSVFSRLVRDPVPALTDSLQIEASRAVVYAVTEGGSPASEVGRHLETLRVAEARALRLGEIPLSRRIVDCRAWLLTTLSDSQRVQVACLGEECVPPSDPADMALWLVLAGVLLLAMLWGWAGHREAAWWRRLFEDLSFADINS